MKNVMWNMFKDTGRIDAYLFYCNCNEENQENKSENGNQIEQSLQK